MSKMQRSVFVTRFGPWMRGVVDDAIISEGYTFFQSPDLILHPALQGYAIHQPPYDDGYNRTVSSGLGMIYKGDTIVLAASKPPAGSGDSTPKNFPVKITNRVQGNTGEEQAPTVDQVGYTWREISDAYIQHIQGYLSSAPSIDHSATTVVGSLKKPDANLQPVDDMVNGKLVRLDPSFFESAEFMAMKTETGMQLRAGALKPAPTISPNMWSEPNGADTYWDATINMEWIEAPKSRVDVELPATWLDLGTEYVVYSQSFATATQAAYEAARDAHNAKLEAALLEASKGNAVSANTETDLKTRPANTTHPLVKKEADEWWNKVNTLVYEVKKVPSVTGLTDTNLATKFPKGAGGMTIDELDAYIKAKRLAGDTTTTKELIDALTAPTDQKTNQPWWSRVLDTVDGFGAGTKEVLTSWGPMGTVGVYGGVKAVDGVSSGSGNWLWIALAAGAAILLLK